MLRKFVEALYTENGVEPSQFELILNLVDQMLGEKSSDVISQCMVEDDDGFLFLDSTGGPDELWKRILDAAK